MSLPAAMAGKANVLVWPHRHDVGIPYGWVRRQEQLNLDPVAHCDAAQRLASPDDVLHSLSRRAAFFNRLYVRQSSVWFNSTPH